MLKKLSAIERKYNDLTASLMDPEVIADHRKLQKISKEQSDLRPLVDKIVLYRKAVANRDEAEEMLHSGDAEMRELAEEELLGLRKRIPEIEDELKFMLIPKDPRDEKNVIVEIRAGTGGDEAALFAAELFRMYAKYAEARRWRVEVLDSNETGGGGLKEIVATIEGRGAYSRLKYESGVHRVQRVPVTEASGRIHTSAATVAVLPEAEEVEVAIEQKDLRIDTFCASGPGGQGVNTTYSAVRIVHVPTGIVVQCQDERSQIKNREKAMKVLRARLLEAQIETQEKERADDRKAQVGSGDRSERIRTYNFPQNRITDHRIGLTLHRLTTVIEGDLDELIDTLQTHYQTEKLKSST